MSLAFDLVLAAIILICAWRGFRTGIINGVSWIVALVVAVYGANLVSSAYYSEFADMLEPFAIGVVENILSGDDENGSEDAETVIDPGLTVAEREKLSVHDVSIAVMARLGVNESAAESIASETARLCQHVNSDMAAELTRLLCDRLAFVALFAIAFAIIAIIFTIIGNVFDLSFGLPGHENLNHITGAALGVIRGIILVMVLACLCRYVGIVLPEGTFEKTVLFGKLVETNRLADMLHI